MYAQYRNVSANGAGAGMSLGMETANGTEAEYVYIGSIIEDNTNADQHGTFVVAPVYAGSRAERLRITSAGSITTTPVAGTAFVINEGGVDADFRVESNNNANLFNIDGGTDEVRIGTNAGIQSIAHLGVRQNGSAIEFGHENNGGGYYGTLGAFGSSGRPYIGFSTFCEASANTFTTTGSKGHVIFGDLSGNLLFSRVETASATGQTPTTQMTLNSDGTATFAGDIILPSTGKLYSSGDTDSYLQFNQPNTLRAIIGDSTRMIIEPNTTIFNEDSADVDFRVESNGYTHMLFVDAGNDSIGIGTSTVYAHQQASAIDLNYDGTIWAGGTYWAGGLRTGCTFYSQTSGDRYKHSSRQAVQINHNSQGGNLLFYSAGGGTAGDLISWQEMAEFARDEVVFNNGGVDQDFRVESDTNANMLFVDGGNNKVGMGTGSPQTTLEVRGGSDSGLRVSGGSNTNNKVEIGYDATNGPYIKAGSSGVTKLQVLVDNNSLAAEFRANGDFYSNDGTVHSLSDARVKTDINDLADGLDIVKQLKPRTFKYTEDSEFYNESKKDEVSYGFVANEVEEVAPQYTNTGKGKIGDIEVDDLKSLSTTKMIPMLVKAIQEQQTLIEKLTARITELENA